MQSPVFRGAIAVLVVFALALTASARELLAPKKTLSGKAIIMELDFGPRDSSRLLLVKSKNKRPVHVTGVHPSQLEKMVTGMDVVVEGQWDNKNPKIDPDDPTLEDPAATGPILTFTANIVSASGGRQAPPTVSVAAPLTAEERLADEMNSAGVMYAVGGTADVPNNGYINVTQGGGMFTYNDMMVASLHTLIIPIVARDNQGNTCPGTQPAPLNKGQLEKVVFEESNPHDATVGSTFKQCSNGKTLLTTSNSMIADHVRLPCSGVSNGVPWTFSKCDFNDFNGYADAADAVLRSRGINVDNYFFRVYLVPPGPCGFVGLGYMGCDGTFNCRSWIGGGFWGTGQVMVHELGHNLYFNHAGSRVNGVHDEYADETCAMGYCCNNRCWNMPHAWQIGWNAVRQYDHLVRGRTYNTTMMTQSMYFNTILAPKNGIRIVPTWQPEVAPIWLSYRTRVRGDANIWPGYDDMVHIHSSSISNPFDTSLTSWEAMLQVGQSWTHPALQVTVRRYPSTISTVAVITICRYAGKETYDSCLYSLDYDCNGLAGEDDPACFNYI